MGILQVRILEWVAMPSSRGFSQPKDRTQVSLIVAYSLPSEPPGKQLSTIDWFKQHTFISNISGGWEDLDPDVGRFGSWCEPSSGLCYNLTR